MSGADGSGGRTADVRAAAAKGAAEAAGHLVRSGGFARAEPEGTGLRAVKGRYTCRVQNTVLPGPAGNRERMLDLYAARIVEHLLRRQGPPQPPDPG